MLSLSIDQLVCDAWDKIPLLSAFCEQHGSTHCTTGVCSTLLAPWAIFHRQFLCYVFGMCFARDWDRYHQSVVPCFSIDHTSVRLINNDYTAKDYANNQNLRFAFFGHTHISPTYGKSPPEVSIGMQMKGVLWCKVPSLTFLPTFSMRLFCAGPQPMLQLLLVTTLLYRKKGQTVAVLIRSPYPSRNRNVTSNSVLCGKNRNIHVL